MELPETIGRFEIERILGRGAMGVVYLAKDPVLDREVAVKVIQLHPGLDEKDVSELKSRFEVEARAAARMSHPNLVTIFDAGLQDESLYLAMEYVRGEGLDSIIASDRLLTYKETADILLQLGGGLDHAHDHGIVHRDIKPANILINRRGQPKITDFGVAREATSNLTTTGTIIGTPAYMSPEQITGHKVSGASDQFSLAVMLYEMLTGRKPFFGAGATTIMYKIVHEDPEQLNAVRKTLPAGINGVVMHALAKEPSDRYPSCYEFAEAVRDVLGAAPADEAVMLGATAKRKAMEADKKKSKAEAPSAEAATQLAAPGAVVSEVVDQPANAAWLASVTDFLRTTNGKIAAGGGAAVLLAVLAMAMFAGGGSESTPAAGAPPPVAEPIVEVAAPGPLATSDPSAVDTEADPEADETGAGDPADDAVVNTLPDPEELTADADAPLEAAPIEVAPAPGGVLSEATLFALAEEQQATRRRYFPMRAVPAARVDPESTIPAESEAQLAPVVALPPVDPVQVRGNIEAPELLEKSELELPDWAIELGLPRYVLLELVIDREARIRQVKVVRAVHPELERLAIEAVRMWRFRPAARDGVPIDVFFNVAVAFDEPGGGGAGRP